MNRKKRLYKSRKMFNCKMFRKLVQNLKSFKLLQKKIRT